jgi:3-methyladenine DNA glycosylase Mpg
MVNPLIGESLVVRIRGEWMAAEVIEVAGRNFTVRTVGGEVKDLIDTSHLTVQQKGWDLDRTAANRIANH